ncbi:MAG: putative Ntn-hydrolase superfamily protein [Pseudohongiellaceae bacterium]|jgi:uncharacterized Ntn-hydrolase superfamily protein
MRRSLAPLILAVLAALAPMASATWSIVLTDMATGEVAVGTATCLEFLSIKRLVPVIVAGVGAGATQSQVDPTAKNKKIMVAELHKGTTPKDILALLKQGDLFKCSRQYSVVNLNGEAAAFSGGCNGNWKGHLKGQVGTITYSIQGNVLTGLPVIEAAEAALLNTSGTLSDRLMAAMLGAASLGGDGRCSCPTGNPAACGSPPVDGFSKSAHIGSMILGRVGDTDAPCIASTGCAAGDYWMDLNVADGEDGLDPVLQLQQLYKNFRKRLRGTPDGVASETFVSPPQTLANGLISVRVDIDLRDLDGLPVPQGGATLEVAHAPGSAEAFHRMRVQDHGSGSYTVELFANPNALGTTPANDLVQITVRDGGSRATLYPYPSVSFDTGS